MSTYILRLDEDGISIIGGRNPPINNAFIPDDSVEVTAGVFKDWGVARQTMRADIRSDKPQLIAGVVVIPTDSRPVISIAFNKSSYKFDELATVDIDVIGSSTFNKEKFYEMMNSIYLFEFSGGVANRTDITFRETGKFEIKSTYDLKVDNPKIIKIYR